MKKLIMFCAVAFSSAGTLFAATDDVNSEQRYYKKERSLYERVTKMEKKSNAFNFYLNMQTSLQSHFGDNPSQYEDFNFKVSQLRLEIMGDITDKIFYRYRQRLNRSNQPESLGNVPNSLDYAAVGYRFTPDFSIFIGRQSTCFGGFEFDLNPIDIYQYTDLIDYMSNYFTGGMLTYNFTKSQQLQFQVLNSRAGSFEEFYGQVPAGIEASRAPLGYTLNWNGGFWDNLVQTRWSASVFHQATDKNWYYYALGTKLNVNPFDVFFDFQWSNEGIDRTGVISNMLKTADISTRALDTRYMALVMKANYKFLNHFNAFLKGWYEQANLDENLAYTDDLNQPVDVEKGKYSSSWGYVGGIEYHPVEDSGLKFFLTYIGRSIDYTDRAKSLGVVDTNPQRLELGLIYKIPMY